MKLTWNQETGEQAPADSIKRTAIVQLLDGSKQVIHTRRVINIWPKNGSGLDLQSSGNEAIKPQVNFAYDYWVDV